MRRTVALFSLCCALAGAASCRHQPLPVVQAPTVSAREDALPTPPLSTLVIPLSVPLSALQQLLQERLQLPGEADWRNVTAEGESPEVAIRYQAELAEAQLASAGNVVHTTLPIRYHGSFRARAQTPFGSIWLTKNTRWGSRERPGTIALTISSELSIDGSWQLASHSTLTQVALTAPDVDKLCAGKVFKVCVPVDMVKGRVHRELEQQVRARAEPGLRELDAQVAARVDLPALARAVWQRLQAGLTADGETLLLAPEGLALGHPAVTGDAVVAELRVWARPRWSAEGTPVASPLPPPSELGGSANDVHLSLALPFPALSQGLSTGLAALPASARGYRVSALSLIGPAASPQRYLLAIALSDDDDSSATAYGEASLLLEGASVGLSDVQLGTSSEPLLAAAGYPPAELSAQLAQLRQPLAPQLDARLNALRALLASSVSPWPASPLPGVATVLTAAYAGRDGVTFTAVAR